MNSSNPARNFRVTFSDRPGSSIEVTGRVPKRVVYSALAARGDDTRRVAVFHTRDPGTFYVRMNPRSSDQIAAVVTECVTSTRTLSPEEYRKHNPEQPPLADGKDYRDCTGGEPNGRECGRPDCRYCATNVFE